MIERVEDIARPQPVSPAGCTFRGAGGTPIAAIRLEVDGHSVGSIADPVEQYEMQLSPDGQRASVQLTTKSFRLAADARVSALRFAQRQGTAPLDGWVELRAVPIKSARDGVATVEPRWPTRFERSGAGTSFAVKCAELTPMFTGSRSGMGDAYLKQGTRTAVHSSIGGPEVGVILTAKAPPRGSPGRFAPVALPDLELLETRGAQARVRLTGEQVALVGWIASSSLDTGRQMAGLLGVLGAGGGSRQQVRCGSEVPLHVRTKAGVVEIGVVRENGRVAVARREGGNIFVHLDGGASLGAIFGVLDTEGASRSTAEVYIPEDRAAACVEG